MRGEKQKNYHSKCHREFFAMRILDKRGHKVVR
jgi:hypothetical protein